MERPSCSTSGGQLERSVGDEAIAAARGDFALPLVSMRDKLVISRAELHVRHGFPSGPRTMPDFEIVPLWAEGCGRRGLSEDDWVSSGSVAVISDNLSL